MKKILTIILIFSITSYYGQQRRLTIQRLLSTELNSLDKDEHSVEYSLNNIPIKEKEVKRQLEFIKNITKLTFKHYKAKIIQERNHTIRIYNAFYKNTTVEKLVEIKSVYHTFDKKKQYEYLDYFIILKNKPKHIQISFDENGICGYELENNKVAITRETIILVEDKMKEIDIEEKKEISSKANEAYYSFEKEIDSLKAKYFK
jgi:hypothetical protein